MEKLIGSLGDVLIYVQGIVQTSVDGISPSLHVLCTVFAGI